MSAAADPLSDIGRSDAGIRSVYLDGFSTMPLAAEAERAMLDVWRWPANSGSPHALGERAADIIDEARRAIAKTVGSSPGELTFTSGATEANNLAILGGAGRTRRRRIIVSAIEHKSVLEPALSLQERGFEVALLPVDHRGLIDLVALDDMLDDDCWLVSVMAVNNETGLIEPVREVADCAHRVGALMHCDAVQALGKVAVDVADWDVDFASFSAHKVGGPCGIGALYVAAGAPQPEPLLLGGGQQAGRRPGTEPTALIAGFGAAATVAEANEDQGGYARMLAATFLLGLREAGMDCHITTDDLATVPGSLSLLCEGLDADDICARLSGSVFLSTGSACTSRELTTSHVLRAMGLAENEANSVVRIMVDRRCSREDMAWAAQQFTAAAEAQRLAGRSVQ